MKEPWRTLVKEVLIALCATAVIWILAALVMVG